MTKLTKQQAKKLLNDTIKTIRDDFDDDHTSILQVREILSNGGTSDGGISGDDMQKILITLKHMSDNLHELNQICGHNKRLQMHSGSGIFDDIWSGIKSVVSEVPKIAVGVARKALPTVGNMIEPGLGTFADTALKSVGMGYEIAGKIPKRGKRRAGELKLGGEYIIGGNEVLGRTQASRTPQRYLDPSEYV